MTASVLQLLDDVIARLGEPLSARDAESGWNELLHDRWRAYFVRLRASLVGGAKPDASHLVRWLEFDGIATGPLCEAIRELEDELARVCGPRRRLRISHADAARFVHQLHIRR